MAIIVNSGFLRGVTAYIPHLAWVVVFVALLIPFTKANAQLVTATGSPVNMVQDVLLGQGITVSNITFNGTSQQIGSFTYGGGNPNMGLPSGVILSTGRIGDGMGPNNSTQTGVDFNLPGDPTLNTLVPGNTTFDAAVLEFDFIPQSSNVSFRYVFASEEYPEFVGSQYNDVFGFFISGPGFPPNGQNIAIIPGTNTPVTINNVNQNSYNNYYRDNTGGTSTQFDGFTTVLSTKVNLTVVPCSTYRIKIAIADVADGIYDSAVLLEENSFISPTQDLKVDVTYGTDSTKIYEGCGQANLTYVKSDITTDIDSIEIFIEGNATNGVDYTDSNGNPYPSYAIFPPNTQSLTIPLIPVFDGVNEPNETITITIKQVVCEDTLIETVTLNLINVNPMQVVLPPDDTVRCPNQPYNLNPQVSGGISPYSFAWSDGQTAQNVSVFPQQTTTYTVNVTDNCNAQSAKDSITIYLLNYTPLAIIATPDTNICPGDSILLTAQAIGGRAGDQGLLYTYEWSDNLGTGQAVWVKPASDATYTVSVTDSCGTVVVEPINVGVWPITADFDYFYIQNRVIKFNDLSEGNVLYWYWDFGDGDTSRAQSPLHTYADTGLFTVTLVVENKYGCTDTMVRYVRAYPDYALYVPNAFTPNGDGTNENFSAIGEGFVNYEMYIFNRWGEQVFKTTEYTRRWDGRDKSGNVSPQGIYVYLIRIKTPPGDEYTLRGSVALIN